MTYKTKLFLIPAILVILALIGIAYFTGRGPIPAVIGLPLTDEIEISLEDLAEATAMAQSCNDQNYPVDAAVLATAAATLNEAQKTTFNTIKAETLAYIDKYPSAPKRIAKDCKSLNRDFQIMSDKTIIIIE